LGKITVSKQALRQQQTVHFSSNVLDLSQSPVFLLSFTIPGTGKTGFADCLKWEQRERAHRKAVPDTLEHLAK